MSRVPAKARKKLLFAVIDIARPTIQVAIAKNLSQHLSKVWVPIQEIVDLPKELNNLWSNGVEEEGGIQRVPIDGYLLYRYKMGWKWCLWASKRTRSTGKYGLEILQYQKCECNSSSVMKALRILRMSIESDCKDSFDTLKAASSEFRCSAASADEAIPTVSLRMARLGQARSSRSASRVEELKQSTTREDMLNTYSSYTESQKKEVITHMVIQAKQKDVLEDVLKRISTKPTAMDVLTMFDSSYVTNRSFFNRLLTSNEAENSVAPRAKLFSDLSKNYQGEIGSVMASVALKVANVLFPNDGKKGSAKVLEKMLQSRVFRNAVLPDVYCKEKDYNDWVQNPIVRAIHASVSKLGKKEYAQRKELLSVLAVYPQSWIRRYFGGVGRKLTKDAKDHSESVGAGLTDKDCEALTRNRRYGPREDHFQQHMSDPANVKVSPEINRDGNGNLVSNPKKYRVLGRSMGYNRYAKEAVSIGITPYGRSHFYQRHNEMKLKDLPKDNGLCPSCDKFSTQTWAKLRKVVVLMFSASDKARKELISEVDMFEQYFERGGPFYHSLEKESKCIHWCTTWALSDPANDDFYQKCNHDHTESDEMVVKCDIFFNNLLKVCDELLKKKKFVYFVNGVEHRIKNIRKGIATVLNSETGMTGSFLWTECEKHGFAREEINFLVLREEISRLQDRHLRLRCHLYLDRNQTHGENEINYLWRNVVDNDYMMKLRAAIWRAGSQDFHILMNKGCSVHVMAVKRRLKEVADELKSAGAEAGDLLITHIDTFCSNTGQGGYETLCVLEAGLKKAKEIDPSIDEVAMCQDAGSGYKSTQVVLGLRNSMEVTGVRVRWLHFNASGEGKRETTDGHNAVVKAIRNSAMRAGKPAECTTPRRECLAQQYNGGIDGAVPLLLEFDYNEEESVKGLPGISKYHDFEFLDNGDIRVWYSYGVGPGKLYKKDVLDKLYAKVKGVQDSVAAPGSAKTKSRKKARAQPHQGKSEDEWQSYVEKREAEGKLAFPQGPTLSKLHEIKCKEGDEARVSGALFNAKIQPSRKRKRKIREDIASRKQAKYQNMSPKKRAKVAKKDLMQGKDAPIRIVVGTVPKENTNSNDALASYVWQGHGLVSRDGNELDPAVDPILEMCFQQGVARESNRKGVLEMEEMCIAQLPFLLVPHRQDICAWLSSRLEKEKSKGNKAASDEGKNKGEKKNKKYTEAEKKQRDAVKISQPHFAKRLLNNEQSKQLFEKKYLGVLLNYSGDIRIITSLFYSEDKKIWCAKTNHAAQRKEDDREYISAETDDIVNIEIGRRQVTGTPTGYLGKYIDEYNKTLTYSSAAELDVEVICGS